MNDTTTLLSTLQLSDSAFPIGRFVHSQGVESWLDSHPEATEDDVRRLALTMVEAASRVDAAFVVHAYDARALAVLTKLDTQLTARKIVPGARTMSTNCGHQLASLATDLVESPLLTDFAGLVREQQTDGNLAIVTGVLARALELSSNAAVAMELRGVASAVFSAAVRLGRVSPMRTQGVLARLHPEIAAACDVAVGTELDAAFASMPELEIAALTHHRLGTRFFTT